MSEPTYNSTIAGYGPPEQPPPHLPFTGMDIGLFSVGFLIVALGIVLRRFSRGQNGQS